MKKVIKWDKKDVLSDAQKYTTRTEWKKNSKAYWIAQTYGYLDEACAHMSGIIYWTDEMVMADALKYSSRLAWQINSSAYSHARKKGLLDKYCAHMKKPKISFKEQELLAFIHSKYPNAKSKRFSANKKSTLFKFLELDIFIPELNKGIEFDGTYYHSFEILKKNRPHWTDEQIRNYHTIKDSFFSSLGIPVLHIKESEWKSDKESCLKKALAFLEA